MGKIRSDLILLGKWRCLFFEGEDLWREVGREFCFGGIHCEMSVSHSNEDVKQAVERELGSEEREISL